MLTTHGPPSCLLLEPLLAEPGRTQVDSMAPELGSGVWRVAGEGHTLSKGRGEAKHGLDLESEALTQ